MPPSYLLIAALLLSLSSLGHAYKQDAKPIKITQSNRTQALGPGEQLGKFKLAEGFIIELVASEKNGIINPIDLTFDGARRLWTQTAEMYPLDPMGNAANRSVRGQLQNPNSKIHKHPEMVRLKRLYQLKDKGTDRIVVIDDPTKPLDGQVRRVAEGLTMPQSILPYKNGVYVAHGSEMLYLEDADGDGVFEKPTTVLTGFSYIDSHTMSHLLIRAPGGWINFSHGAMNLGEVTAVASGAKQKINYCKTARFSLDGKKLELVTSGLNNIWGYQLRSDGQWYGSEANDKGLSIVPMEPGTGYLGIGNDKLRPYQPMVPQMHQFVSALLGELEGEERKSAVERLSLSIQGAGSLVKLLAAKNLTVDDFNYLSATRVAASVRRNPTAGKLMKVWSERKRAEEAKLAQQIEQFANASTKLSGNPAVGEGMFQMCLSCHSVGEQGFSIAPALDGSSTRETHALLTAILLPDVAVEGGYELYRVIRKDGSMVEGYLYSSNEIGVTIAAMGNSKTFVPRSDVRSEGGVPGKSFMPALLNELPEQSMIDLISYIQTLK